MSVDTEDAWRLLDNAAGWLRHAEAKLTAALGFLGLLAAGLFAVVRIMEPSPCAFIAAALASICLVVSGYYTVDGLLPRRAAVNNNDSTVFYAHIASRANASRYLSDIDAPTHDLRREVLRQVYNVSKVADKKYDSCVNAYKWLVGASILTVALAALISIDVL
ncbi:Pycsar system effector family protein [Aeromicrobium sp. 179-A 4D2 NHS]|uniref:Pycsar system effector family protein n=1 Tax=Aeromicrobium sp. 179-A 4D2 NHS TaxID=3142375 RepID=UPI0039A288F2